MCGICGVIYECKDKRVSKDALAKMNNVLVSRGPDDEGYFIYGNIGLGMRRLSIIDVKGGQQPIYNEDKSLCVVCNGEIYNYQELRQDLLRQGHVFSTHSDVEVIIHLYEEYGQHCVDKLRGMFAFAIYDNKSEALLLARDRLGIKPLYYTYQNGTFLFASELKAILKYPGLERKISNEALSDYLTFLYIPAPETIFENINKLPPAHILTFNNKGIVLKQYWEINYHKDKEQKEEYYVEKMEDLLKETVKMHLMSEVPLGAFLSGGVDSSAIVALISEISNERVKTFSVGFDVPDFNELEYARLVAKRFGTEHHEINLKPDILALLPKLVEYCDEPFADSSIIPTYLISQFARERVTVCLAGDGGDELFAGYGWTRRQKFIQDYNRLPALLRNNLKSIFLGKDYSPDRKNRIFDKLGRFMHDAGLPVEQSFMRRKTCFSELMKKSLFKEQIFNQLHNYDSKSKILPYFKKDVADNALEKLLYLDTKMYLPDDCLCKVDRMSMMNSLEVRVPLLDHKVVEFAASIPFKYKMKGMVSKYILKQAMKNLLPLQILRQRKLGFTVPLNSWFRQSLKGYTQGLLLSADARLNNYFRQDFIRWLIKEHNEGRQDFGPQIFALAVLELWLQHYES